MQLNVLGLGLGFKSQNLQMKVTFAHLQLNHCFNHGVWKETLTPTLDYSVGFIGAFELSDHGS